MKRCGTCKIEKSLEEFHKGRNNKDGLQYVCKECTRIFNRNSHLKRAAKSPHERRQLVYGLSPEQYFQLITLQKGRCVICASELGPRPQVDHNHATGKVRGLLCRSCNWGLGHFKDSSEIIRAAADYLDRTK